jgi:hypothetical protein
MSEYDTYIKSEFGELAGKTVLGVRALKQPEIEDLYWQDFDHKPAMVIMFTDGTCLIPSADEECNGPGFLIMGEAQ